MLHLIRHGRRRSLQEGVQLLLSMEQSDMPTLFSVASEVVRATDAEQLAATTNAATNAAAAGGGGDHGRNNNGRAANSAGVAAGGGARPQPQRTVWWHQIDDRDDESYNMKDVNEWGCAKDLNEARLLLMKQTSKEQAIATLEKLRGDLLLYARDAGS